MQPGLGFWISFATGLPSQPARFAASFQLRTSRPIEPTLKLSLTRHATSLMALKQKK